MPEGDTIFRTAATLRRWLVGREITGARSRVVGVTAKALVGTTVTGVEAQAKHLLVRFSNGATLHTHMRMSGSWHVYPAGERWRKPVSAARLVLEAGDRLAVCFDAPVVELLATARESRHPALAGLGPDVLGPAPLDLAEVWRRAQSRATVSPTVGELLIDQQVVSGIGNVYRCEALFRERIDPATPVSALTEERFGALVTGATQLMQANVVTAGGPRSFGAGPGRPWVYRRSGRPCRRCGTKIRQALLGHQVRSVYWCPRCQPPGSAPANAGSWPGPGQGKPMEEDKLDRS